MRRFCVGCLAHDPAVVGLAVTSFGEDRIVLGSDRPHPTGAQDPRTLVAHRGEDFVRNGPARVTGVAGKAA